ncbi:MAG: hypothetical protein MGF17_04155 [Trichodesmium sp. MAG_R04]|nr:hypothetical protein [Trichodesmium sp. MAG_R04]
MKKKLTKKLAAYGRGFKPNFSLSLHNGKRFHDQIPVISPKIAGNYQGE